jgi:hypothetical protein
MCSFFSVCPPTITQGVDPGHCSANVTYALPFYTDNCGAMLEQNYSASASILSLSSSSVLLNMPVGNGAMFYIATDDAGHASACAVDVVVIDNIMPELGMY